MTRINFYHDAADKHLAACKVAAKALQQQLRVLVYARDPAVLGHFDKLLWTWQATGFTPHCMADHPLAPETPLLLTADAEALPHDEVLVNLDPECPPGFSRFQRLVEIISLDDEDRESGRKRYRFYRDRGYPIESHKL